MIGVVPPASAGLAEGGRQSRNHQPQVGNRRRFTDILLAWRIWNFRATAYSHNAVRDVHGPDQVADASASIITAEPLVTSAE
jgi:hypothetical protein